LWLKRRKEKEIKQERTAPKIPKGTSNTTERKEKKIVENTETGVTVKEYRDPKKGQVEGFRGKVRT